MINFLNNLDRRIIFVCILLATALPLKYPIKMPITVTPEVKNVIKAIDELPENSKILLSADYDPASGAELDPMTDVIIPYLFERNIRIVAMGLWPQGPTIIQEKISKYAKKFNKKYGVDYINLGYKPGAMVVINKLGIDFPTTFPTDINQEEVTKFHIMRDVHKLSDFPLLINLSAGTPGIKEWVKIGYGNYQLRVVGGCTAVSAPEFYPYLNAGQLYGLAGGLAGAAELETGTKKLGKAVDAMPAQSFAHATIIFFIIFANIIVFFEKLKTKRS